MSMRKISTIVLAISLVVSGHFSTTAIAGIASKKFSNCKALNKKYPGGVAKSGSVTNTGGTTHFAPTVSAKIYKENKSKDRDHDGIACER